MKLYNRYWRLVVHTIEIVGLRVTFSIERTMAPPPNPCEIKVYNLSEDSQRAIAGYRNVPVSLEAGYQENHGTIFLGKLYAGYTRKEGTNYVTTLTAADGENEMRRNRIMYPVPVGMPNDQVLEVVAKAIGVGEGNLGVAVAKLRASGVGKRFAKGTVLYGNAAREMTQICRSLGLTWSVQNEKLQILGLRESLEGTAIYAHRDTGLIGHPEIDQSRAVNFQMLLQPDIVPGRKAVVDSELWQGQFRLEMCTYVGDTHGNDWYVNCKGRRY